MEVTKRSQLTGKLTTLDLDITDEQLDRVESRRETGTLIQKIVPHLPVEQREFLISGITKAEWDEYFGTFDEYDDEKYVDENPR